MIVSIIILGGVMPSPTLAQPFNDVATDYWAFAFIEDLAAIGITSGCGNNNYCSDATVTRDQVAVFLVRTFDS